MFTLQILDRGQTFLHALGDRPTVLGSAPDADVRLGEVGVEARHATFTAKPEHVLLESAVPVIVNGRSATQAALMLGDRIELGRAVVLVGHTVPRAAGPEDVLADAVPRERRRPAAPAKRNHTVPLLVGVLGIGVLAFLLTRSGGSSGISDEMAMLNRWRADGQLERAASHIEKLRVAWADSPDDRLALLEGQVAAIQAVHATVDRLVATIVDPADRRTYSDWSQELQRLEREGQPEERIAARRVRGSLRDTIEKRPRLNLPMVADSEPPKAKPADTAGDVARPVAVGSQPEATPKPVAPEAAAPDTSAAVAATSKVDLAEVERLSKDQQFAQAIDLLQSNLAGEADAAAAGALRDRIAAVRGAAKADLARLLGEAQQAIAAGKPQDAAALLASARPRFPATAEFEALPVALASAEQQVAAANAKAVAVGRRAVDAATRTATLASLRAQLDAVRAAEDRGDYAATMSGLRAAAEAVRDRDPEFAARLTTRADEAELLAAWHEAVAAALPGRKVPVATLAGSIATVSRIEGGQLVGAGPGGELRLEWNELAATGVQVLLDQLAIAGRPALGAATLLYRMGAASAAETLLAKVLRADAAHKDAIDRVLARGRGEPFDPRGYTLGKDGFTSARSVEVQKDAQKLAVRIESALRDKDPAARKALVDDVIGAGPEATAVLAAALQREFHRQIKKLETSALRKQVDKLAEARVALDQTRVHAKELIYDEVKYFYPYKPPAVSSDKYAEYLRVQAEVDRRVAVVRTAWSDERVKVRVPSSLRADLDRLDWVAKELGELGELDAETLARVDWARALPTGDTVTVKDFCLSLDERLELEEWRGIHAFNAAAAKNFTSAQRELLRITNDYRAMFRHRPLAMGVAITAASQGHADEMSKLGYFSHMSPTQGRRTPTDRMRLAGYTSGASENIALVDGAQGAHGAWCTSSGHHRNLLDAGHREIGIGANGRYWVQNFGSGKSYLDDPVWKSLGKTPR